MYTLLFNRGNGIEKWYEPFATVEEAVSEADSLLEFGNGFWFQIERDGTVVMDDNAVMDAIVDLAVNDEDE